MFDAKIILLLAALVAGLAEASAVHAETVQAPSSQADLKHAYDAAFQQMLMQPANLDVLFKFATLATQTGDFEGAVSALERMLLADPDLPRVRMELGALYYRLGSYEMARSYLDTVLQSPGVPPDVRGRAEQLRAKMEKL